MLRPGLAGQGQGRISEIVQGLIMELWQKLEFAQGLRLGLGPNVAFVWQLGQQHVFEQVWGQPFGFGRGLRELCGLGLDLELKELCGLGMVLGLRELSGLGLDLDFEGSELQQAS